ncbi:MAG: Do family serine endopeptidase [Gammaproteobacteria bacterium]|nr:Do family serine endopeptidase [Gammaproteobacteria bacterium]
MKYSDRKRPLGPTRWFADTGLAHRLDQTSISLSRALPLLVAITFVCGLYGTPAFSDMSKLPGFAQLVKHNAPAVVNISTDQGIPRRSLPPGFDMPDLPEDSPLHDFLRRFLEEGPQGSDVRPLGSGFIISNDGYILTNAHVIADASEIVVRLTDRRELTAEVVGSDRRTDVALLKIDAVNLPTVTIGDPSRLSVGEWVLAIGSPFGFESSATAGIVSAKGRSLPNENYVPFIQTDVAINPGNSGGPLFNLDGEVVGINAQIYSGTGGFMGLSFAIPIDLAMNIVEQLRSNGHVRRGWLGVGIQRVTSELAESFNLNKPKGALISEIISGGPASRSDLKEGDVIVTYRGQAIDAMSELPPLVGATPVGEEVELEVVRNREAIIVTVVIDELPEDKLQVSAQTPNQQTESESLGIQVEELTQKQRADSNLDHGVAVTEVGSGPGSRSGLRAGDLILQVDGKRVEDVAHFKSLTKDLPSDRSIPVLIRRSTRSLFIVISVDG